MAMKGACERVGVSLDQIEDIIAGCVNPRTKAWATSPDGQHWPRGFRTAWPDPPSTGNGGAVAIGHPFGASGTRYVLTLAELRERNVRYGVAGVCVGSGQGVAIVLENPSAT
jgi:acetyl-CoA acetyltransferase